VKHWVQIPVLPKKKFQWITHGEEKEEKWRNEKNRAKRMNLLKIRENEGLYSLDKTGEKIN
jgi:hypothetical protein